MITQLGRLHQARYDGSTEQIRHAGQTLAGLYARADQVTTPASPPRLPMDRLGPGSRPG